MLVLTYFLQGLFIFSPFLINPLTTLWFEPIKVYVIQGGIEIVFISYLLFFAKKSQIYDIFPKILLVMAGLIIFQIIIGYNEQSLLGNEFRLQGSWLLLHLLFIIFFASVHSFSVNKWIYAGMLVIQTSYIFYFGANEAGRYGGSFGEPNALALFLCLLLATFVNGALIDKIAKSRIVFGLLSLFTLVLISLTQSRSGILSVGVIAFIYLAEFFRFSKKITLLCLSLILLTGVVGVFFDRGSLLENRKEIWITAIHAGWQKPIIGHGFGNIEEALTKSSNKLANNIRFSKVDSSHNIILDFWVQGGIIGLALFSLLLFTALKKIFYRHFLLEFTTLFVVFTMLLFNPASVWGLFVLWLLIGNANHTLNKSE